MVPCFADPQGTLRVGDILATVYTVNQGEDEWHVLYAWRHGGSLYTVSEHVHPPYTYKQMLEQPAQAHAQPRPRRAGPVGIR